MIQISGQIATHRIPVLMVSWPQCTREIDNDMSNGLGCVKDNRQLIEYDCLKYYILGHILM